MFNFDKKRELKEDGEAPAAVSAPTSVPGGAYPSCPVSGPFQTLYNTVGIGNPVPGGSDRFDRVVGKKIAKKKGTK